ncbi:MAG: phosphoglycolate phosphatase [Paracoccaceae bacterium]
MAVVIFDLDGTLIDSAPDIHAASNRVLAQEGFADLSLAQVRSFIGKGVPHLVERLLDAVGEDPKGPRHAPMVARFTEGYEDAVGLTLPYPGVREALAQLQAAGHVLGICTNKPVAPTRAVLAHLGMLDLFAAIYGGDSLPQRKPDPAPLHATHAALGGGPVVYVGDSEVDAETAAAAGMRFAIYTEGYRKTPVDLLPHDADFTQFSALAGIVERLLAT